MGKPHRQTEIDRPGRTHPGVLAFTLAELLVCLGIVTAVVSILLPSVGALRRQVRVATCTSNIQKICFVLQVYAGANDRQFPPNVSSPAPGQFWCDRKRIDGWLGHRTPPNISSLGGGALACPEDEGGQRSYAMNFWASSTVDGFLRNVSAVRGEFWAADTSRADVARLILVAEAYSAYGSGDWFTAAEVIGLAGDRPGQRFGGGGGIAPPIPAGRFNLVNTELPFGRHRVTNGKGAGRVQIGFADGHVALLSDQDLLRPDGSSRGEALWSPADPRIEP